MAKVDTSGSARAMERWLLPFAALFTQPSWLNAVALATGALLCLNRRTVCAALRAVDGNSDKGFSRFHRFLSRAEWSGLQGAKILLGLLQEAFVPEGEPLVVAIDDAGAAAGSATTGSGAMRCARAAASSSRSRACGGCRCRSSSGPASPDAPGGCRS